MLPGFGIDLRYDLAHFSRERFSRNSREDGVEIEAAFGSLLRRSRPMDQVFMDQVSNDYGYKKCYDCGAN